MKSYIPQQDIFYFIQSIERYLDNLLIIMIQL